jgi:hypothetical protein
MAAGAAARIMLVMTRSITSSKVLLIADRRGTSPEGPSAPVRRYRIARLRLEGRSPESAARFEHLKRVYD